MSINKSKLFILILLILGFSTLLAQDMITVYPKEYSDALSNPLKGFRPDPGDYNKYPYPTVVRDYIKWNEIENHASDGVQKIIDFCNSQWAGYEKQNIKVIPRVYLQWHTGSNESNWPADLKNGDWYSDEFKERVVKLIAKLGEAWDDDPRVAWIQTGIIGYWGEQENPVGVDEDGWAARMGEAFENAFPNKLLTVRNQDAWEKVGYKWGVYWDSFAHPGQENGSWTRIRNANADGRYLSQVVEGEVAYNWGEDVMDTFLGGEPDITLSNSLYYNNLIDVIRELHCSALGWVASYNPDDPNNKTGAMEVQKEFGYRFVINEFSTSKRVQPGSTMDINFKVKNTGSAPFYENWPLAFVLIDESTKQIVWTQELPDEDITKWYPGNSYDYTSRTYLTPAEEYEISASVTVPSDLTSGQYMAGLTILEPYSRTPGVFFAVENFLAESQSQPLTRIGIGSDIVGSYEVDSTLFDDPVSDNNRSYALEWKGQTYNLTTSSGTGGNVTPGSNVFRENQKVRLKATANLGYEFSEWSGDLSGSENPVTINMDKDKNITANFIGVPTYTLTINSTDGSISLDPPGGEYNEGTEVTIEVKANLGYKFSEWSGDLTGSDNPATITMDGSKNITANLTSAPIYTLTTVAADGHIILDPPGPQYTEGTVVKLKAEANDNYFFTGWSGDPLNYAFYINPNYVTMDSDKNITADFILDPSYQGLLKNGDFSSGLINWDTQIISPANATISVVNKECKIDIQAVSNEEWHVNILQSGIELESNVYYTLTFDARANADKTILAQAQFDHDPWTTTLGEQVNITTTMKSYSVNWLQEKETTTYKVGFFFGSDTTNVWIDNVELLSNVTSVEQEGNINPPENISILQNYPNPFNPTTSIKYQLTNNSIVSLKIYNVMGELVKTLVQGEKAVGYHQVQWDGKDENNKSAATGMYIYSLQTDNYVESRKMILMK